MEVVRRISAIDRLHGGSTDAQLRRWPGLSPLVIQPGHTAELPDPVGTRLARLVPPVVRVGGSDLCVFAQPGVPSSRQCRDECRGPLSPQRTARNPRYVLDHDFKIGRVAVLERVGRPTAFQFLSARRDSVVEFRRQGRPRIDHVRLPKLRMSSDPRGRFRAKQSQESLRPDPLPAERRTELADIVTAYPRNPRRLVGRHREPHFFSLNRLRQIGSCRLDSCLLPALPSARHLVLESVEFHRPSDVSSQSLALLRFQSFEHGAKRLYLLELENSWIAPIRPACGGKPMDHFTVVVPVHHGSALA